MAKKKPSLVEVNCPICGALVKARGLHSHLRLVHPNCDIEKELRKVIVTPALKGERVIFQVLELPEGLWKLKHVALPIEDLDKILELLLHVREKGSINNHPLCDIEVDCDK